MSTSRNDWSIRRPLGLNSCSTNFFWWASVPLTFEFLARVLSSTVIGLITTLFFLSLTRPIQGCYKIIPPSPVHTLSDTRPCTRMYAHTSGRLGMLCMRKIFIFFLVSDHLNWRKVNIQYFGESPISRCRRDVTEVQFCAQIQVQVFCTRVTTGLIHHQFIQVIDLLFILSDTSRSKTYLDQLDCALTPESTCTPYTPYCTRRCVGTCFHE